ncbi:MAG: hypothetical protein WDN67_00990 [Candidatus Moraniibacteriota bacterium]
MVLAEKRLAFDEMLALQLKSLEVRALSDQAKAEAIPTDEKLLRDFSASLPFTLTGAQQKAISSIAADLAESRPMNRLLNGDVGSGKTAVAAAAALLVKRRKTVRYSRPDRSAGPPALRYPGAYPGAARRSPGSFHGQFSHP